MVRCALPGSYDSLTYVGCCCSDARAAARKLPTRLGLSQSKNDDTTVPHRLLQQTTGTAGSVRSVGNQVPSDNLNTHH